MWIHEWWYSEVQWNNFIKKKKSKKAKMFLLENQTVPMVNALITCENVTLVTIKQMSWSSQL